MNNVEVKRVDFHKHLGVTINNDCMWHEHVSEITSKTWKRINIADLKRKGRDLTQSYDKSPYTNRTVKRAK